MEVSIINITVEFDPIPSLIDYPKGLPIPRIGETIIINDIKGRVKDIIHFTIGSTTQIKIYCT